MDFQRQMNDARCQSSIERIDSLSYLPSPAMMLRNVRGITVKCTAGGCTVHTNRPPDCLWLFVDGVYSRDQIDDVLTVGGVYAIEVFERAGIVPMEFQAPLPSKSIGRGPLSLGAGCGAVVVWTRARAAP
jgi:hypothetical protein